MSSCVRQPLATAAKEQRLPHLPARPTIRTVLILINPQHPMPSRTEQLVGALHRAQCSQSGMSVPMRIGFGDALISMLRGCI